MKKWMMTVLAVMTAGAAFSATQYGLMTPHTEAYNATRNFSKYEYDIVAFVDYWNNSPTHYGRNMMEILQTTGVYVSVPGAVPSSFGAVTLTGSSGKYIGDDLSLADMGNGVYALSLNGVDAYAFDPGTRLAFWVMDSEGNRVYNVGNLYDGNTPLGGTYAEATKESYYVNYNPTAEMFSFTNTFVGAEGDTYQLTVGLGPGVPSGQPLPGVVAALVLGGGLLAARRRK